MAQKEHRGASKCLRTPEDLYENTCAHAYAYRHTRFSEKGIHGCHQIYNKDLTTKQSEHTCPKVILRSHSDGRKHKLSTVRSDPVSVTLFSRLKQHFQFPMISVKKELLKSQGDTTSGPGMVYVQLHPQKCLSNTIWKILVF